MNSEIQSIDLNQIKALGIQDKEKAINLYMKTTLEQFEQFRFETHNAQVKIRKNFYYFIPFSIITLISFVIYSNSVLSYIVLVLGLFAVFIKSYFLAISFDHKYNLQLFLENKYSENEILQAGYTKDQIEKKYMDIDHYKSNVNEKTQSIINKLEK